jgi:hypothetical protein
MSRIKALYNTSANTQKDPNFWRELVGSGKGFASSWQGVIASERGEGSLAIGGLDYALLSTKQIASLEQGRKAGQEEKRKIIEQLELEQEKHNMQELDERSRLQAELTKAQQGSVAEDNTLETAEEEQVAQQKSMLAKLLKEREKQKDQQVCLS